MVIGSTVKFIGEESPRSVAVAGEAGEVVACEMRDGEAFVNVLFPIYGAVFCGISSAELTAAP